MANHKSALKKNRKDEERRIRNRFYKTRMKNVVKAVETAVNQQDRDQAQEALHAAVSTIDRVASKGVIHKNKAARQKSRLTKKVNALMPGE